MQTITKIMLAVIILCMSITQFYQGKTISRLQDQILSLAKNQTTMTETDQMNTDSIKNLTEAMNTQNKTIRTMLKFYR